MATIRQYESEKPLKVDRCQNCLGVKDSNAFEGVLFLEAIGLLPHILTEQPLGIIW